MSAITELDRMDLPSLERAAFQRGDILVAQLAARLIDAEGVAEVKPHLDEAYSQFPEEDFLEDVMGELRELAGGMRGLNRAKLNAIVSKIEEIQLATGRAATDATAIRYKQAFVDGTLKKRKQRNSHAVKVWIENRL